LQETEYKIIVLYYDNDISVPTVRHGVFVIPDKRIQLAMIERDIEEHHTSDLIIAYTRDHIIILQQVFGVFFGIGAHVRHPKAESQQ
jgi:hypothetical protein